MTLSRQFTAILGIVFALVFSGTIALSVQNTRVYLGQQLGSHAQDAATSLGLSLSPHLARADLPLVESMIDAIFDGGFYREIVVHDLAGKPVANRTLNVRIEGVPNWFMGLVPLITPLRDAEIMSGWKLGGRVSVRSHPGYAYRELWANTVDTAWWAAISIVLAAALTIAFCRSLLRPLKAVEAQALAIAAREFPVVERLPGTRELRQVVIAMNTMSRKVRQMLMEQVTLADRMREEAYSDVLTGLANRRSFDRWLQQLVSDRERSAMGAVLLVQIAGLAEVNTERGYTAGDDLVKLVAQGLAGLQLDGGLGQLNGEDDQWLARISGSEFGILVGGQSREEIERVAELICSELRGLTFTGRGLAGGHVGAAYFQRTLDVGRLLSEADMALRHAQNMGQIAWHVLEATPELTDVALPSASAWRETFARIIVERDVVLHFQEVRSLGLDGLLHYEVLARISNPSRPGKAMLVPAGIFLPVAARLGFARSLDQIIVEKVIAEVKNDVAVARFDEAHFAVNLTGAALRDAGFVAWLVDTLMDEPQVSRRLIFEVSEYAGLGMLEAMRKLALRLEEVGAGLAFDHFGTGGRSFGYLQGIRLSYIKLDGGFVAALPSNPDERFFVNALVDVAHGLELPVIAERVETDAELEVLRSMGVDGVQGYLIARPGPRDLVA